MLEEADGRRWGPGSQPLFHNGCFNRCLRDANRCIEALANSSPHLSEPMNRQIRMTMHKIHVAKVFWVSPYAKKDEERCNVRLMLTVDQPIIPSHSDV
jgi:hypothetical protein